MCKHPKCESAFCTNCWQVFHELPFRRAHEPFPVAGRPFFNPELCKRASIGGFGHLVPLLDREVFSSIDAVSKLDALKLQESELKALKTTLNITASAPSTTSSSSSSTQTPTPSERTTPSSKRTIVDLEPVGTMVDISTLVPNFKQIEEYINSLLPEDAPFAHYSTVPLLNTNPVNHNPKRVYNVQFNKNRLSDITEFLSQNQGNNNFCYASPHGNQNVIVVSVKCRQEKAFELREWFPNRRLEKYWISGHTSSDEVACIRYTTKRKLLQVEYNSCMVFVNPIHRQPEEISTSMVEVSFMFFTYITRT
jgi:hypothetical protein